MDDDVLRKIRKCLALASDCRGDPGTAGIAMRQAQALMAQHGITGEDVTASECTEEQVKSKVGIKVPPMWEKELAAMVCKSFGCSLLWQAGGPEATRKGRYTIFGPASEQQICSYTFAVLQRELLKARNVFVASLPLDIPKGMKVKQGDSFCIGWVFAVQEKVAKFADPTGARRRLLISYAKRYHHVDMEDKTQSVAARTRPIERDEVLAGYRQGQGVALHKPMKGDKETPPLLDN